MGKLINTTYHDTVKDISSFYSDLIHHSLYTLNDKKPTIVTYYNINKSYSSLDPGSKLAYDPIGENSPLRFNKIDDFILYGVDKIELATSIDEFGLEADKITGEAYILPSTIIPYENDYFEIDHISDSSWLFQVTDVQKDTLDNGKNAYKIAYKLEYISRDDLMSQVVSGYTMIEHREGTNIVEVVRNDNLALAKLMDERAVTLKKYFTNLFYNEYVQTYIYQDLTEFRIYDPYMIEFLIRNKILSNGEDSYIHVMHQIPPNASFGLEYDRTFFRAFEKCDKERIQSYENTNIPDDIHGYGTVFDSRYEKYFKAKYIKSTGEGYGYKLECLHDNLIYRIKENNLIEDQYDLNKDTPLWQNIIIRYFNDDICTEEELKSIDRIEFTKAYEWFYYIPLLIFCLEKIIEKTLART